MTNTEFDADQLEFGRWLFAQQCTFMLGVANLGQLPNTTQMEVCFAGRSNVGKSSLINTLTGHKNLARTSSTPGRTQQINMFDLGGQLVLSDLPGYGYAKAPLGVVKQWQDVIFGYLRGRPQLRRVYVLIDSRHGVKNTDTPVMQMLDKAAVSYQLIFTKTDKIGAEALEKHLAAARDMLAKHPAAYPEILLTSSEKNKGIAEVRAAIANLLKENQQ